MPELPEVETVRRGLEPFMAGQVLKKIDLHRAGLRMPFPPDMVRIEGRKISELTRRAKYLLIHFEGGKGKDHDIMVIHLGMSGRMTMTDNMSSYDRKKHDHMVLTLGSGTGVIFNDARRFGMVFLIKDSERETHPAFKALGPEPLGRAFTGTVLAEKLKGKKVPIKLALLDQRVVSGIGNIYACEALFKAGIDPRKLSLEISKAKLDILVEAIKDVLNRSIKAGGSSLKDYRQADGQLGYFQHSFLVYGKQGKPCPRCSSNPRKKNAVIHKITQGGRSTFYCPSCQS